MKHGFNNNNDNMWDFTVQCDRKIEARRPDIVFIDIKGGEGDDRVTDKEQKSHCSACCYWGPWSRISQL